MSPVIYENRQIGWATGGPVALILGVVVWQLAAAGLTVPAMASVAIMAVVLGLFGSLSVSVDHTALRLRFGVGLIRKTVPIRTILGHRIVETRWFYGWGIRLTPTGWLWNVAGLDAVELDLAGGAHFTVGTDDPEGLHRALARARG